MTKYDEVIAVYGLCHFYQGCHFRMKQTSYYIIGTLGRCNSNNYLIILAFLLIFLSYICNTMATTYLPYSSFFPLFLDFV